MTHTPHLDTAVLAIGQWHQQLSDISNAHFPKDMSREQLGYNPMQYFDLLPRLRPPAGRVLDQVYHGGVNGSPFLYWRDANAPHHLHADQCTNEPGWTNKKDEQVAITCPVLTDDSPDGWAQLVVLHLMAGRAMLRSHAGYKHVTLLCGPDTLKAHLDKETAPSRWASLSPERAQRVSQLQVLPTVDLSQPKSAVVQITRYSPWGGYFRQTWTMQRQGPNQLRMLSEENVLQHTCGFRF